jgi:hypothetical protein
MVEENPTLVDWPLLSDVLRHVVALVRKPEADIRWEILEAMRSGSLPHLVEHTIRYLPRRADASNSKLPPTEVTYNRPVPSEMLVRGGRGGLGSLHIDWQNSRGTRRAGATWARIRLEGIRCSRERMLVLWPTSAGSAAQTETPEESTPTGLPGALGTTEWLGQEVARRKAAGNIPTGHGAKKRFSEQLETQMDKAFRKGNVLKALSAGRISNLLTECGFWSRRSRRHS